MSRHFLAPNIPATELGGGITANDEVTISASQMHYFNSHSSIEELISHSEEIDFTDCQQLPWIDSTFDFGGLQEHHSHVFSHIHQQDPLENCTMCDSKQDINQDISPRVLAALSPNTPTLGAVDLYPLGDTPSSFSVIVDSGASLAISPNEADFVGPIAYYSSERRLGGMAGGMQIKGIGKVAWSVKADDGILTVHSKCYYVPQAKTRLLSPQQLFCASQNINGSFTCRETHASLEFDSVGSLRIDYDSGTYLPVALAKNLTGSQAQANIAILSEENQNLTPAQKLLLLWHAKFGHKGFGALQRILRAAPFASDRFKAAARCETPRCEVCEYAKAHRKGTRGAKQTLNTQTDGNLKLDDVNPGSTVSVDHFESRLRGRTLSSLGRSTSPTYVGGCVFVDHMSGYIHVEEQLGFSASETIRAKQAFERLSLNHGIVIQNYLCDNGIFKGREFVKHLQEHNQKVKYCGVNAHHKNGVAE